MKKEDKTVTGKSSISRNQVSIPDNIREAADIENGNKIEWLWKNGKLDVEIIRQRNGYLEDDFDRFEPDKESVIVHNETELKPSGKWDTEN